MKIDKFHYHEFIHATSMLTDDIENHLLNHHIGENYKTEIEEIQSKMTDLYNKVSGDSDEKFQESNEKDETFLLVQIAAVKELLEESIKIRDPVGTIQYQEKYKQLKEELRKL